MAKFLHLFTFEVWFDDGQQQNIDLKFPSDNPILTTKEFFNAKRILTKRIEEASHKSVDSMVLINSVFFRNEE
ncbi:MAG: hypothetical protein IKE01_06755 [Clostridia bacterium]|nr:hypothetical protein [Clostridia bacterium]